MHLLIADRFGNFSSVFIFNWFLISVLLFFAKFSQRDNDMELLRNRIGATK